ncbi:MAG: nucleoside monophosphate kinase [Candidatus Paceibacterota bacterium]
MRIAIIMYGSPGSGKGTQAKLIAEKLDIFHFDTGQYLRSMLYDLKFKKNKIIQKERELNESGKLNTTSWVLKMISQRVKKIASLDQGVVFSGSPRTLFETFGDNKQIGLMKVLEKYYGKKNIFIFMLNIHSKESIKRNISRLSCLICHTPIMAQKKKLNNCPFCGGKLKHRTDDKKEIILTRLKEYQERTKPIFKKLKERGYWVKQIDGTPLPYKIHQRVYSYIRR